MFCVPNFIRHSPALCAKWQPPRHARLMPPWRRRASQARGAGAARESLRSFRSRRSAAPRAGLLETAGGTDERRRRRWQTTAPSRRPESPGRDRKASCTSRACAPAAKQSGSNEQSGVQCARRRVSLGACDAASQAPLRQPPAAGSAMQQQRLSRCTALGCSRTRRRCAPCKAEAAVMHARCGHGRRIRQLVCTRVQRQHRRASAEAAVRRRAPAAGTPRASAAHAPRPKATRPPRGRPDGPHTDLKPTAAACARTADSIRQACPAAGSTLHVT